LIENWPVLWQPNHKSYGKRGPGDAALKKVAASLGEKGNYLLSIFYDVNDSLTAMPYTFMVQTSKPMK